VVDLKSQQGRMKIVVVKKEVAEVAFKDVL
jgi:hypothetical protein